MSIQCQIWSTSLTWVLTRGKAIYNSFPNIRKTDYDGRKAAGKRMVTTKINAWLVVSLLVEGFSSIRLLLQQFLVAKIQYSQ